MVQVTKPPFRADHVGSLLRPPELLQARDQREKGIISVKELRSTEDRCICDVVKLQEDIGLHGITDGEYRRSLWHADFLSRIEGVVVKEGIVPGAGRDFQGGDDVQRSPTRFETAGKLRRRSGLEVETFKFLQSVPNREALDPFAFVAAFSRRSRSGQSAGVS
jgi:5-methyltetrahydropteroyltriglutamate--homocysteine methyltransferase